VARARRTAIITFVVAASGLATLGAAMPMAAGAVGHPSPLTSATSARPATTAVVGRTASYVVYNDTSNHVVYLGNPGGKAAPTVLARSARATVVSGDLVEYTRGGIRLWRNLATSQHGTVPATWTFLAPDGGMRVRRTAGKSVLDYLHLDGSTKTFSLPDALATDSTHYSVVAGTGGVAVAANTANTRPKVAYSTLRGAATFAMLRTDGMPKSATLTCSSLSSAAVGCLYRRSVVRLSTDGVGLPQTSTPSAQPLGVAVTDGYTSWTSPHLTTSHTCPCNMASIDTTGTAVSIVAGLTSGAITAGRGRFFYSSGTQRGRAGVYVDLFAGAGDVLVAPAARRPLHASVPALGPGRAAWADDSRSGGALWAARVRPNSSRGSAHQQAGQVTLAGVAVSGPRIVYSSARQTLHLTYRGHDHAIARGTLVNLSGSLALYRSRGGHLILLDLLRGTRVDETATRGARAAALWGHYLSYLRADGSVWRVGLSAHVAHRPVRLAGAVGHGTATGQIYSFGSWTAWSVKSPGAARVSAWRKAGSRTATRKIAASDTLVGASAGGAVVARSHSGGTLSHFALLGWWSGRQRAELPGRGHAPTVEGSTVGWLRDGVPTVADIGIKITNRPRSLGNASAPARTKRGSTWRLELATSAPLTRCSVTVRNARYHRTLACAAAQQAQGDVFVHWPTAAAPAGNYQWTIHAAGHDGTVMKATGGKGTTTGHVTVA
jgi:hypothetical protein